MPIHKKPEDYLNTKFIYTGLFFIFIFISGFLVSRSGKPYNVGLFTIHKLVGVALGIFLIVTVSRMRKIAPLSSLEISVLIATILIFVALVAAGGLLSIQAEGGLSNASQGLLNAIGLVHKLFPYLGVLSTSLILYLLLSRRS